VPPLPLITVAVTGLDLPGVGLDGRILNLESGITLPTALNMAIGEEELARSILSGSRTVDAFTI